MEYIIANTVIIIITLIGSFIINKWFDEGILMGMTEIYIWFYLIIMGIVTIFVNVILTIINIIL